MSERLTPRDPRALRALNVFLRTSGTLLLGQIDGGGVVVSANPGLGRWLVGAPESRLEAALRPGCRARWQRVLAAPGRRQRMTLWFGPSRSERAAFRCWLVPEEGGMFWLFGEPKPAPPSRLPGASGEGREDQRALRAELDRSRRRARWLAGTDVLTGLANRSRGLRRLAAWARRAGQRGTPLACLMIDLDRFKAINDTFGHPVGDRVLREAARTLAQGLRGLDLVARYGGDEFLVLLPATTSADALAIADRLRAQLAGRRIAPLTEPLGASFGVAMLVPGESAQGLLRRADAALLHAKRDGRGRVVLDPPASPEPVVPLPRGRGTTRPGEVTETR